MHYDTTHMHVCIYIQHICMYAFIYNTYACMHLYTTHMHVCIYIQHICMYAFIYVSVYSPLCVDMLQGLSDGVV